MNIDIQAFARSVCNDKRTLEMFRNMVNYAYVRVVNYHNTLWKDRKRFEDEIAYFSRHFQPVVPEDLTRYLDDKKWPYKKPGIILTFYDGYRNQYDTVYPLLEKYHMKGWFFIPTYFIDIPARKQKAYAEQHALMAFGEEDYPDGRIALSWRELQLIAKSHVICCHTGSHCMVTRQTTDAVMRSEIIDAKERLEAKVGQTVKVFAWQGGEEYLYNLKAHKYFEKAGYDYVVSDLKIERIH